MMRHTRKVIIFPPTTQLILLLHIRQLLSKWKMPERILGGRRSLEPPVSTSNPQGVASMHGDEGKTLSHHGGAMRRPLLRLSEDENRLLVALPPDELDRLRPHLMPCALLRGDVLFEPDAPPEHIYFPQSGVIALVAVMRNGDAVESTTIGREGLVGCAAAAGLPGTFARGIVQIPGRARRIEITRFRTILADCPVLRDLIERYREALLAQVMQAVACNALHSVEQRFCRWLLTCRDRTGGSVVPLTQEAMAEMLGVQRTTVTAAARSLQSQGLIRYRRGLIECVDIAGLEAASCECYGVVRERFEELLPSTYVDPSKDGAQ